MSTQDCEHCGKSNPPDALYCFACGHILPAGLNAIATHSLPDPQSMQPQIRWGTAYFGENTVLRIRLRDTGAIIEAQFDQECLLGRSAGDTVADIDLAPHNGLAMGVSRQHARLTRQSETIMIQDLGSVNGTFLNGARLLPHQPRVLRNEDELCLGRLMMRITFVRTANGEA